MINKDNISESKLCSICLDMLDDFNKHNSGNTYEDMQIKTVNTIIHNSRLHYIEYIPIIPECDKYDKYPISIKIKNNDYPFNSYIIEMDVVFILNESGWISASTERLKRIVNDEDLEINPH